MMYAQYPHAESVETVEERFLPLVAGTACPYARHANIAYAPEWDERLTVIENTARFLPALHRFTEHCRQHRMDMYVVEVRGSRCVEDIKLLVCLLNALLHTIRRLDSTTDEPLTQGIETMSWDFIYNGVRFFVPTFAPFYKPNHPRYSYQPGSVFILFQPDTSFDRHKITSKNPKRGDITRRIKEGFEARGFSYDVSLVAGSPKALRYIKPINFGQEPIRWWRGEVDPTVR